MQEAPCYFCKAPAQCVQIGSKFDGLLEHKSDSEEVAVCERCVQTVEELDAARKKCEELKGRLLGASHDEVQPTIARNECEKTSLAKQPYVCEVCGRAYKQRSALEIHVGMHEGINPYTCTVCDKSFTQKSGLQRHIPIHTGEKSYQCEQCGKRFVHHSSFNFHLAWHTGSKRYKCELCGLALMSGPHLKRHMRSHAGEKRFECTTCGKRFTERYNLSSHRKLHDRAVNVSV